MNRSAAYLTSRRRPMANMTPLIDVVFQLIIFFLLAAQFSRQQAVELDLPRVETHASDPIESEARAVINVVSQSDSPGADARYRVGSRLFDASEEGLAQLAEALRAVKDRSGRVHALIRASRAEPFEHIHPAMRAVQRAGIERIELVVAPDPAGAQ